MTPRWDSPYLGGTRSTREEAAFYDGPDDEPADPPEYDPPADWQADSPFLG